jgi:glycosyltransferase involved in cell wall biosynthesis
MINPKISVIMATYNSEKFLDESIQSILNQIFKDFEFIIINDCSTDSSSNIIKKYAKQDKRIVLVKNKKNIGLTKSLNKGIKIARGKYIARQDSDDISLPERLEKQYQFLEKNKDVFLCGTDLLYINEDSRIIIEGSKIPFGTKTIQKKLRQGNCFIHTSIMFRNQNTFYREKFVYSQDYDLYLNLLNKNYNLDNLKRKLVKLRYHNKAISFNKNNQQKLFASKAQEFYLQRIKFRRDEYEKFNPNEILKAKEVNSRKILLEGKMKIFLKSEEFGKAKKYFKEYKKAKNIFLFDIIPFYLFIYLPITYRIYRKIVYRNDFKK